MGRRIVIEEHGTALASASVPESPRLDLQDVLLLSGVGLWEIAAAVIWWPAALILGGAFCLGFAWTMERARAKATNGTGKS